MVYRGQVIRGAIVLDEGVELPEGAEVRIALVPATVPPTEDLEGEPLARMTDLAVETGIPDLASHFDRYWELRRDAGIQDALSVIGTLDEDAAETLEESVRRTRAD